MLDWFGLAATTSQLSCNDKLCFKFANKCGGAVALRAITGSVEKRPLKQINP